MVLLWGERMSTLLVVDEDNDDACETPVYDEEGGS
jgi:hypothetical protein